MLRALLSTACTIALASSLGCSATDDPTASTFALTRHPPHTHDAGCAPMPSPTTSNLLMWTDAGELALVDGGTFEVLATRAIEGGGKAGARDLDVDRTGTVAALFLGDEDGGSGEIAAIDIGPATLGDVRHVTWFDGDARVTRLDGATLLFARGYAEQWKLVRDDLVATASAGGPPPLSVVRRDDGVDVLARTDDGDLVRSLIALDPLAWPPSEPAVIATDDAAAAMMSNACGAWLVQAAGDLTIRNLTPYGTGAATVVGPMGAGAEDIAAAAALSCAGMAAVLLPGPARVATFQVDDPGHAHTLSLPGTVEARDPWFSRALVRLDDQTAVIATDAGVFAVVVDADGTPSLDAARSNAHLRGPVSVVPRP